MSFDLHFVRRGVPWREAMEEMERAAMSEEAASLSDVQLAHWDEIVARVREIVPGAETFPGDDSCEISDPTTGTQLTLFPSEIALSVPYWYSDDDADTVTDLLRRIVEVVEGVTGLVAYDPQADAAFLGEGASIASATMTDVRGRMLDHLGNDAAAGDASRAARVPWWRRLLGRS